MLFFYHIALLLVSLALSEFCWAEWSAFHEEVQLERLLKNVKSYVERNPKDGHGHYTLGRLNSLAFAMGIRKWMLS